MTRAQDMAASLEINKLLRRKTRADFQAPTMYGFLWTGNVIAENSFEAIEEIKTQRNSSLGMRAIESEITGLWWVYVEVPDSFGGKNEG
jgi:hypothetical protein